MTLKNRMTQAKKILAKDPKSQDPRVLEMKDRISTARKESEAKKRLEEAKKAETKANRTGAK